MTYAILGAGNVGKALAKAFARKDMEVTVASRRSADELEPVVRAIGPKVYAGALQDAVKADVIPVEILAQDPQSDGARRVLFLSSDESEAAAKVAAIVTQLGYAPVMLGKLAEGGLLIQARGNSWAPLIFQDLFRKEK
jgi:predicted dinucleotide-binding enzyme